MNKNRNKLADWHKPTEDEIALFNEGYRRIAKKQNGRADICSPVAVSYRTIDNFTLAVYQDTAGALHIGPAKRNTYGKTADPERPKVGRNIAFSRAMRVKPIPPPPPPRGATA